MVKIYGPNPIHSVLLCHCKVDIYSAKPGLCSRLDASFVQGILAYNWTQHYLEWPDWHPWHQLTGGSLQMMNRRQYTNIFVNPRLFIYKGRVVYGCDTWPLAPKQPRASQCQAIRQHLLHMPNLNYKESESVDISWSRLTVQAGQAYHFPPYLD